MKRSEILENRKKAVEFLKQPERKKCGGRLVSTYDQESRCCLGHMCESLIPETKELKTSDSDENILYAYYQGEMYAAPPLLVEKLGLHGIVGGSYLSKNYLIAEFPCNSLAQLNDNSPLTTQEIGAYLESVIEGGDDTPWKNLSEYEE